MNSRVIHLFSNYTKYIILDKFDFDYLNGWLDALFCWEIKVKSKQIS